MRENELRPASGRGEPCEWKVAYPESRRRTIGLATALAAASLAVANQADAIPTPTIPQNPFMAPNGISAIHLNAYQTDTSALLGPGSVRRAFVQNGLLIPPTQIAGTLTFNGRGQIIGVRVGLDPRNPQEGEAQVLFLADSASLRLLDEVDLPPRPSNGGSVVA